MAMEVPFVIVSAVASKAATRGYEADFIGNKDARRREIKKPGYKLAAVR
jgi:hypothetical protein